MLSILDELRSRRLPVSAEVLAEALGVSVRTIYRDMATLQSIGLLFKGKTALGLRYKEGTFLPPLHFAPGELDAIIIGMRMIQSRGYSEFADAASRALNKIGSVLSGHQNHLFLDSPILVHSFIPREQTVKRGILSELCEAIPKAL